MTKRPKGRGKGRVKSRRPARGPQDPFDAIVGSFAGYDSGVDAALVQLDAAELLVHGEDDAGGEVDGDAVLHILIPEILVRPGDGAVALLLATASLLEGPVGRAARLAAAGMIAEGTERPAWADELELKLTASTCMSIRDEGGVVEILGADLHRGDRGYTAFVIVNRAAGDTAEKAVVFPEAGRLPQLVKSILGSAPLPMTERELSPPEFRDRLQHVLDGPLPIDDDEDDDLGPSTTACALVLRVWADLLDV
jgi:hypothetical protein